MALPIPILIISLLFTFFLQKTLSVDLGTKNVYEQEEDQYAKIIKNDYGDIYDCVNIYKQPSLIHPLLKNHKIQVSPSFISESISTSTSNKIARERRSIGKELKIGLKRIRCPIGNVPIRRTQTQLHSSSDTNKVEPQSTYFAGTITKNIPNKIYHGARAITALYKPTVKDYQMSGVALSLENDGDHALRNIIQAGWMVNPELYGDTNTRLYTKWADYGDRTGCYNIECPGFIQISTIPLDLVFNITTTGAKHEFFTRFEIEQDTKTGNWWFLLGDVRASIGYWPKEIVPKLAGGAQIVKTGGIVSTPPSDSNTPPMGSGTIFKKVTFYNTAYFAGVQFVDENYQVINGDNNFIDREWTRCYLVKDNSYKDYMIEGYPFVLGFSFLYGGQGGDTATWTCPPS